MKEIDVYTQLDEKTGITYIGADEVNNLIKRGAKVISIEPGLRMKQREGDSEHLYMFGWLVKVIVDDSNMSDS
jgi:hypothetical protein